MAKHLSISLQVERLGQVSDSNVTPITPFLSTPMDSNPSLTLPLSTFPDIEYSLNNSIDFSFSHGNDDFQKVIQQQMFSTKKIGRQTSPVSPETNKYQNKNKKPFNNSPKLPTEQKKKDYNFESTLFQKGFQIKSKIGNTLQGQIFSGENILTKQQLVIKITNINLHKQGITIIRGKPVKTQEDIIHEKNVIQYLQANNPPNGFIKIIDWFKDKQNYFLIMEHGGEDFFHYVNDHHEQIQNGKLSLKKWKKYVQYLFVQMVLFVKWLHDSQICHLDISLENMLIHDGVIHFCDFGLAEIFSKGNFQCKKYVGKENYMCPQICGKKGMFDGRSADIWSLGICLFTMLCGAPLYYRPSLSDPYYQNLFNGHLKKILKDWSMIKNVDKNAYDLLMKMLQPNEEKRISMGSLLKHKYVKQILQVVNLKNKKN